MDVYSGKCKQCEVGIKTEHTDIRGEVLYTGDIVTIFTEGSDGILQSVPNDLSVMVQNRYTSYSDGKFEPIDNPDPAFIMGIKGCTPEKMESETVYRQDENTVWRCIKLKDHRDIITGEHWTAWGFNYI